MSKPFIPSKPGFYWVRLKQRFSWLYGSEMSQQWRVVEFFEDNGLKYVAASGIYCIRELAKQSIIHPEPINITPPEEPKSAKRHLNRAANRRSKTDGPRAGKKSPRSTATVKTRKRLSKAKTAS